MFEEYNKLSQPTKEMNIFNNWDSIVEAWYCVGLVKELDKNSIVSTQIGMQKLVVFVNASGIHCVDAFCAHMGLHLGLGQVVNENLQCAFHHWAYDGKGELVSGCTVKKQDSDLKSYPVVVRYGVIWVWAGPSAQYELPLHQDLLNEYDFKIGSQYSRPSHPHISLLNALDIQHVNTVHALDMNVTAKYFEAPDNSYIHYDFETAFKESSKLIGSGYRYSVRYAGSTVGYLKALEGIKLFGVISFPTIYATFGYRSIDKNKTIIQPIFLTKKRKGLVGSLKSKLHLLFTAILYNRLKNEDGKVYENIRFTPNFTSDDANIISFVAHVNRLPKSLF